MDALIAEQQFIDEIEARKNTSINRHIRNHVFYSHSFHAKKMCKICLRHKIFHLILKAERQSRPWVLNPLSLQRHIKSQTSLPSGKESCEIPALLDPQILPSPLQ